MRELQLQQALPVQKTGSAALECVHNNLQIHLFYYVLHFTIEFHLSIAYDS
jgi:hypothetical protein